MLYTTGRLAKEAGACEFEYRKVSRALGGARKYGLDTPIPLSLILDVAGLNSANWALRCVLPGQADERDRVARLFSCDCAEHVLPIFELARPDDGRPRQAIVMARRFAAGEASRDELAAARTAAWAATWDAAWGDAAWEAARSAARSAAKDADGTASWAAAWDAAWGDAAWDAARDAAWELFSGFFLRRLRESPTTIEP